MYQRQVSFGEAVQRAIIENYCNFNGRASRSEYWFFALFNFIISFVLGFLTGLTGGAMFLTVLTYIISLALLLPGLGLSVRRLHDINRSGWWVLIGLIPIVGAIILIIWFAKESDPVENQYGPVPNMVG